MARLLLGVDLHRDRLVADGLGLVDAHSLGECGAGAIVEREPIAHRARPALDSRAETPMLPMSARRTL